MPQSVGSNAITGYGQFNTLIPLLSETADITEALRLYHFGATTENYNIANTDPAQLPNPGIAYTLYDLQDQIDTISGSLGIAYSEFTAKGDILTATGPGTASSVQPLPLGSQGQVLTVNTATATGLQWSTPYAAPTIGSTLIPSGTTVTTIAGLTLTNPTVNAGSGVIVLPGATTPAQTADGSVVWDTDSDLLTVGTGSGRKTMIDTDSTQTLSNKTLSNPTITNNLYLFDGNTIIFEGSTPDNFETTLTVVNPTADRTITLPNASGTIPLLESSNTFTNTQLISANTSSNALEIRQIGSGNAFVVEDETNPDASPFIIDNAGRVAIGTSDAVSNYNLRVLGQAFIGTGTDISPDASANGYIRFDGSGYDGFITLDGTGMYIGQNASSRNLIFQTNEVDRLTITGTGNVNVGSGTGGGTNTDGLSIQGKDIEIMQIMGVL